MRAGQRATSAEEESWALHVQVTAATQAHPAFHAAYTGNNSMVPDAESATSLVADLFAGVRLWKGAEAYFQPEMTGGNGLSTSFGVAAYPSGEVYRVGNPVPAIFPCPGHPLHELGHHRLGRI